MVCISLYLTFLFITLEEMVQPDVEEADEGDKAEGVDKQPE